ncbi:MAG TPA: glycoside hydrolase family 38 C-terminal domain-containing protein [Gemmatimonadales bacterium]|nr:glycoside hydrolase family 38 C-terminal domain-containing protein [Gemmatimonadales bacterium]
MPLTFHLIFHTHWDREWYLPEAALRVRLLGAIDELIGQLEREPAFRTFLLDGQTILLGDYLGARPDRTEVVRALVRAGRIQIGPWYVLADEQIPSAESLVRNLLAGQADCERWGGRLDVLYAPDAFGHPAMLPDLARELGLAHGVVWRGLGDQAEGRDLVRWRGPGGGCLLVHHLPPAGYDIGAALRSDPAALAAGWPAVRAVLVARRTTPHVAVFVGADHHRAPADPARLRDLLAALEPDHEVRISRLDEFLRAAEAAAGEPPEVAGELRWSYGYAWTLQGQHGTRAPLKRRNAALEARLERIAEPLVALAGPTAGDLRAALAAAWRALLANHFHDSLCGTVSDAVAGAVAARFAEVDAIVSEVTRRALHLRVGYRPDAARDAPARAASRLVLWNPVPRRRRGVVLADTTWFRRDVLVGPAGGRVPGRGTGARAFALVDAGGRVLPVQVVGRRVAQERLDADRHYPDQDEVDVVRIAFDPGELSGLGTAILAPAPAPVAAPPSGGVRVRGSAMSNAHVDLSIGDGGSLTLTDSRTGERWTGLLRLESELDAGDTYTWSPARCDRPRASRGAARVRALARGPLVGVLEARWSLAAGRAPRERRLGRVDARLVLRLHQGSALVHCALELDNGATDHRLRLRLPTGLAGARVTTGTQFGAAAREPVAVDPTRFPQETPVRTAPAHRFAAAADGARGIAVFMPGFFELEWTPRSDLVLTLLRAVGRLSRDDLPARPGHAGWPLATPLAQCLGRERIEFALAPVSADDIARGDALPRLWEDAFAPVGAWWLRQAVGCMTPTDAIELEGNGLVCSAIKPAENGQGIVLRCYNVSPHPTTGRWRFAAPQARALRVRADERGGEAAPLGDGGRTLAFAARAGEIMTYLVG